MDFLSDTTKKEKRNLLAAGFAGIIVAQLQIYPTEMDVVGLKFHSPDLPMVAVGGLCAVIVYFLIKFLLSYLYEQSSAMSHALAQQIREGKTAMDISREEEELNDWFRRLIQQEKTLENRQQNEEKRIAGLQDKIDQEDIAHEAALKVMQQKRRDLDQALANSVSTPDTVLTPPIHIEKQIKQLEEDIAAYLAQREAAHQKDIENLENEKSRRKELYEAEMRQLNSDSETANQKRAAINKWKQAHTTVGRVSPLHQSLEIYFPILVGVIAIWSLISLMLHFPPPPNPPSLPGF